MYYVLSSIPTLSTKSEHNQLYGLSPGSRSRGGRRNVGGFIQAVLFGYGDIRLTMDEQHIKSPARLPNHSNVLILHNLNVRALDGSNGQSLVYRYTQQTDTLHVNDARSFSMDTNLIIRPATPSCL
ncbi:unnamed protein product [Adineta ricciae]|uniref:Uncharacterized protein n=1 Tax=Adineta ricciae TaxID=249248 RepID=A0A816C2Y6_ADIRI|nr:unnamed protein product [Adineta ricciae]